jgi:hypothetical protein
LSTAAQRRVKRRSVLPGFPWAGRFATPKEAWLYVSSDRVQCLICGKVYKSLGSHINRIHGLDETLYKQRFGIPYTVGLVSEPTATRHKEAYGKHISSERRLAYVASARATLKQKLDSGNFKWRPPVSSVISQKVQTIVAVNEAPACNRSCYWCGNVVTVRGARAFYGDEMIRCEECLAPTSRRPRRMTAEDREKLHQWAEDNPERATEYLKARNWWSWRRNPFPLLAYAKKWNARLRIIPELQEAAAHTADGLRPVPVGQVHKQSVPR